MSMEEEAARQAAANAPAASSSGATAAQTTAAAAAPDGGVAVQQPSGPTVAAVAATGDEGDEALLQQALALSEGHGAAPDVEMTEEQDGEDENLTEEEMIARAIEMSMRPEPESEEKKK